MRYALLDHLACPYCHTALTCHTHRERESVIETGTFAGGSRVSAGPGLGPAPTGGTGELDRLLAQHGGRAADPLRTFAVEVDEGLLICGACGRWYPITGELPEVLPDHLRDRARDTALFPTLAATLPARVRAACDRFVPGGQAPDEGAHHKAAEIAIKTKVDDPQFFAPGLSSPFNPGNTTFTLYLLHLFGTVVPLLDAQHGDTVLDSGSGYSWTTEWMYRSGINAIGADICRTYLEIAITRIGPARPHLVVADVEHLPISTGSVQAVLAYESFHHIPDRPRAVRGYDRILTDNGRLVLAEPGAAHEHDEGSVDVMEKYGILEKGMELTDVAGYAEGTGFSDPEQIFLVQARHLDLHSRVVDVARRDSSVEGNIFRLRKDRASHQHTPPPSHTSPPDARPVALEQHFDAHYYAHSCGQPYRRNEAWLAFFGRIADRVVHQIAPARVLDAGCALGLLVETLRARGVEASGIDLSEYAIGEVAESVRPYCRVGSIADDLDGRYDLIVCIEVVEHMPPDQAEAAIANFCRHTDDVLFSSSSTDYGEATHVNVRPPEYWAEIFATHGFLRDVDFDATFITAWAARYRRRTDTIPLIVRDYERAFARTSLERNELRAQVLRFDREIIVSAADVPRLREQLSSVNRQLLATQHQLAQARDQVFHMERSIFWRARNVWAAVRALFGA